MQWKIGPNTNEICRTKNVNMLPSFIVCSRTLHENVDFWRFHRTGQNTLSHSLIYKHQEEYPESAHGRQHPCSGDSGSGHWMKEDGIGIRQVLIGVVTTGGRCGRWSWVEKINNEDAMRWIKGHVFP